MERLETLKLLFEKGFISPSEYDERRRQIVDDITKTTLLATPNETISPTAFHDEEEGFGSKQKAVEEEENFGPKPKHSLQTLNICPNTTTTSTYQPSDFEQEEKELAKEMDITEKYELSRQIGCLPGNCLRMVLEIVKETSPEALEKSGEDWIFDLKTLPSVTLWKLHDYIEAWNKEDNKELGSQGEEKQVLAAAVLTPSEDRTSLSLDTQSRTKGIKRPRALPGTPAKQEKRVTRTIKKSKIASSSSDEDEENETEPAEMMEKEQQSQSERSMEHDKEEKQQKRGEPFKIQVCIYSLAKKNVSARPYICDSCGKTFKDRSNLAQHIRVHTKEKPYVCSFDDCKKSFAHSASLKEHLNSHMGTKPHVCDFPGCGQSFAQASNLRRHQRGVHSGERPFECADCGKKFAQNSNLKQHIMKMHQMRRGDEHMQIFR